MNKFIIEKRKIKQLLISLMPVFLGGTITLFAVYVVNKLSIFLIAFLIFLFLTGVSILLFLVKREELPWWTGWMSKCPKCGSKKIKALNEYKQQLVMNGNHYGYKEIQKHKCSKCKNEFWENERV